jgi:hypothetical protein
MNARVESNAERWFSGTSEQVPYIINTQRTEATLSCLNLEDVVWNFDNRLDCPWVGIYRPSTEVAGFCYGTFWVVRNVTAPHRDEDFASSNGSIKYIPTSGDQPTEQVFLGANTFNATVYNLNYLTPAEKQAEINNMRRPGEVRLCNSLIFNNIPFFRVEEGESTININDPDSYMGCAYKNGRFYQEPLNLDDPYADDNAKDEGDQGSNNWTPDNINLRNLPDDFYSKSGLMTIFTPTSDELNEFSKYLWGDKFDINTFKKIVNNPFDLILGFQYLPFKVIIAGDMPVNVGNILGVDSGLKMSYPTKENYQHSFGMLSLTGEEHKFLDYSPYSKTYIHLPYIGEQVIDTDLIRQASPVELIYKYNIVNGTVNAILTGHIEGRLGVLYEWVGNCNNPLPIATNDYTNTINGMFNLVSNAVVGGISGGAIGGGVGAGIGAISGAISGLNQADLKPTISTQGSLGGCGGCLNASCDAFIITEQQRLSVASTQAHYLGYPRNVSGTIKNSGGYNNIKAVRMHIANATSTETQEITDILTSGYVYGDLSSNGTNHVNPKPSTPSGDNVVFALYQNKSSNIRIDKELTHLHTYDCIIKDATSIMTPTIKLKANDTNVTKGNYGYIPKFKRFYYVTNVTNINLDMWEIELKCDVLMSFRDDIIDHKVIFNHSESAYNLYLNDGSLQMDSRPKITWNKFPNSLTEDCTYVLILAGNNIRS